MNWIQTLFYVVGIIFFLTVIIAAIIIVKKTVQTTNSIKKILTSKEIHNLLTRIHDTIKALMQ